MDACAYFSVYGYDKNLVIKIEGGDLPGKSMRVSAVLLYQGLEFPLRINRMPHKGELARINTRSCFMESTRHLIAITTKETILFPVPTFQKLNPV